MGDLIKLLEKHELVRVPLTNHTRDQLKQFFDDIFHEYGLDRLVAWYQQHPDVFEAEFGKEPWRRHFLKHGDEVVGCAVLCPRFDSEVPTQGEITRLYLGAAYRGKGLGRALLTDLIEHAPRLGFEDIYLQTRVEFVEAVKLYKAAGFQPAPGRYPSPNSIAFQLKL